jgi:Ca2+-transporting ATPase
MPSEAELVRPAAADYDIEETDLNVKPFAFKPHQLASLIYPKSLEKLGNLGGVDGLLRGLGTNPCRGVKITGVSSRDPEPTHPVTPLPLEVHISLAGIPERLRSTASLGGGSGVDRPTSLEFSASAYEATIEDRQRVYGQNILPQRPSKSLLRLMWLATSGQSLSKPNDTRISLRLMFACRRFCYRSLP